MLTLTIDLSGAASILAIGLGCDHDSLIFPDRAHTVVLAGPNQLWVADITYIMISTGLVYLAAILDAWSCRVFSYAISSLHSALGYLSPAMFEDQHALTVKSAA